MKVILCNGDIFWAEGSCYKNFHTDCDHSMLVLQVQCQSWVCAEKFFWLQKCFFSSSMKLRNNHNWTFFLETGQRWEVWEETNFDHLFTGTCGHCYLWTMRTDTALTALFLICAKLQPFQYLCCFIALFFIGLLVLFVGLLIYYFYLIVWLRALETLAEVSSCS